MNDNKYSQHSSHMLHKRAHLSMQCHQALHANAVTATLTWKKYILVQLNTIKNR